MKPLAIDLFCGLGGWTDGLLAEGYEVIGFDLERHEYGEHRYPAQLVLADVLKLHGARFKDAALIVGSSPCQEFSYRAMPWSRARALGPPLLGMELFNAQFRIQAEASAAAGRHIPMVVENVRGAQKWVGRSRWNFGSFHLWGDVPALMPMVAKRSVMKAGICHRPDGATNFHSHKNAGGSWFRVSHNNVPHNRGDAVPHTPDMTNPAEHTGVKVGGIDWSKRDARGKSGVAFNDTAIARAAACQKDGIKQGGDWFASAGNNRSLQGMAWSKSPKRKAAAAIIAKIPMPLARHIARVYFPC